MSFVSDFFQRKHRAVPQMKQSAPLYLFNTLAQKKEEFHPLGNVVRMYNCGPTVYGEQHIGNLSMFVFTDILRRTIEQNGWRIKQVINITDVGHLVSDGDEGEDKMTKGLKREGMKLTLENMRTLAEKYTETFLSDIRALGVNTEEISFPRASDHIRGQIALIATLNEKGYVYKTKDGMYFDTSLFPSYGRLGNIDLETLKEGARVEKNTEKKNPADFALWKFNDTLGWHAPWGKGFPGWHIECSAMARSELGEQIDIHTGGIEHIPVHHNNEIAQTEAATGKQFSRFWLHRAHLQLEGRKFAKSEGRVVFLDDIRNKGFHPLAFRYLLLTSHYRSPTSFTWESLAAAEKAFLALHEKASADPGNSRPDEKTVRAFTERVHDDLDTPGALALLWSWMRDCKDGQIIAATLRALEPILGLSLGNPDGDIQKRLQNALPIPLNTLPLEVRTKIESRERSRAEKQWADADRIRDELLAEGYALSDEKNGIEVRRVIPKE